MNVDVITFPIPNNSQTAVFAAGWESSILDTLRPLTSIPAKKSKTKTPAAFNDAFLW